VSGAARYAQAANTLLGFAGAAAIAIGEASRRKLGTPPVGADTLQSIHSWLLLAAVSLSLAGHHVESRRVHGALASGMALFFVAAASAGVVQIIFGPCDACVLSACAALLSFVLAVVALNVAVRVLAPRPVHLAMLRHASSQSHRSDAPQWSTRVHDVLRLWRQRTRGRTQLGQLTEGQLRDIGLSRADAIVEANKPFWRA